jgi:hypothetical protein
MAGSGHYVGYGKMADGRWIEYDDHRVRAMKVGAPTNSSLRCALHSSSVTRHQEDSILRLDGGAGDSAIAYICIYKAKNLAIQW